MRQSRPRHVPSHCQCSLDDPGMCSFCEWEREEAEREEHDEAFAEPLSMQEALLLDAEILRAQGVDVADPEFF